MKTILIIALIIIVAMVILAIVRWAVRGMRDAKKIVDNAIQSNVPNVPQDNVTRMNHTQYGDYLREREDERREEIERDEHGR